MDVFDSYINRSILKEGGERYTDNPNDKGGPTKWGITEARARAAGYFGDMHDLTRAQAYDIYRLYFWMQPGFDRLVVLSPPLAGYMLDLGINRGTCVPVRWLQRSLNVLNNGETFYPDLVVDGLAGAMTREALHSFVTKRGEAGMKVLLQLLQSFAAVDYVTIAEKNPSQEGFEYGWLAQRAFQNPLV